MCAPKMPPSSCSGVREKVGLSSCHLYQLMGLLDRYPWNEEVQMELPYPGSVYLCMMVSWREMCGEAAAFMPCLFGFSLASGCLLCDPGCWTRWNFLADPVSCSSWAMLGGLGTDWIKSLHTLATVVPMHLIYESFFSKSTTLLVHLTIMGFYIYYLETVTQLKRAIANDILKTYWRLNEKARSHKLIWPHPQALKKVQKPSKTWNCLFQIAFRSPKVSR